jgi:hypothetical protein
MHALRYLSSPLGYIAGSHSIAFSSKAGHPGHLDHGLKKLILTVLSGLTLAQRN